MFNNRSRIVLVAVLLMVITSVFGVLPVGAQAPVDPVYPANDAAKCDFTLNINPAGDLNFNRFLQDNGADGILFEVTHDGWGEISSDKMFTVFTGTWDATSNSVTSPSAGVLATVDGTRFVFRLDEAHKLVVGQAMLMIANCNVAVADTTAAPVKPNDPAICDPSFARSAANGAPNLVRKFVDGSRLMYFAGAEITDVTLSSDTPFLVYRGMINGTGDLTSPTVDYAFTTDTLTYKYVVAPANKLALNEGLMVVWPCTPTTDAGFMSHFTAEPNVDWCGAHVMNPGTTETVPAWCVVTGDVKVGGVATYDNSEFTGVVVTIGAQPVEIYAEWGASIWPAGTVTQTAHDALIATGCANGAGCTAVSDVAK